MSPSWSGTRSCSSGPAPRIRGGVLISTSTLQSMALSLVPRLIVGARNDVADSLSRRHQVLSSVWTLALGFVDKLVAGWLASVTLFAKALNYQLPVYFFPICLMAAGTDTSLRVWDGLRVYAFPPFVLFCRFLDKLTSSMSTYLTLVASFWPQCEWFLCSGVYW